MEDIKQNAEEAYKLTDEIEKEMEVEEIDEKPLYFQTLNEIMAKEYPGPKWLIENILPSDSISVISGNPKNHKTWITMEIARSLAQGIPFLGHFPLQQCSVLVVDEDNHGRILKERYKMLGAKDEDNLQIYYLNLEGFKIDNKFHLEKIIRFIKEKDIKLLILDPLLMIHGGDENDSRAIAKVLEHFKKVVKDSGASILFTHHHRKGFKDGNDASAQDLRGSSGITGGVDMQMIVSFDREEKFVCIKQELVRNSEPLEPFLVKVINDKELNSMRLIYEGEDKRKLKKIELIKTEIFEILKKEKNCNLKKINELVESECAESMVRKSLNELVKNGLIHFEVRAKGERFYSVK